MGESQIAAAAARVKTFSLVFEDFAQLFFQLPLGKDVLDAAPRSLATFAHGYRPPIFGIGAGSAGGRGGPPGVGGWKSVSNSSRCVERYRTLLLSPRMRW